MTGSGLCECGCGQLAPISPHTNRAQGYVRGQPRRFVNGHQYGHVSRLATATWQRRLGPDYVVDENGCWIWNRGLNVDGYGRKMISGRRQAAHRWYYERYVEPVPVGWHVHHKCRVKSCVNPDHLEAVPPERHGHGVARETVEVVLASDHLSNGQLARRFGISRTTVARIKAGRHLARFGGLR